MNKKELIKHASKQTKLSQKDCMDCLNAIVDLVCDTLRKGDSVNIIGFGKFETKRLNERKIINPQTQRPMLIRQKIVPVFRSGKQFKEAVR